jgi:tetratricopeptide (TPR) repeat protein
VFDSTLKEALAVQLGQSPYLNIVPETQVRDTLTLMGRSPDERLTPSVARELCERQGIRAVLTGAIANLGTHYVISLDALNCGTGESLAREQMEADSKEHVLTSLGKITTGLRTRLGESLASVQKFDRPLEEATTSSLEALKAFTVAEQQRSHSLEMDAIPNYKRAIELDPNFALAYARLGQVYWNAGQEDLAAPYRAKAYQLRDRVSERERLYILGHYYDDDTGEVDKAIETWEQMRHTYPRDTTWGSNLALAYFLVGDFEHALEVLREQLRTDPDESFSYSRMADIYLALQRPEEARAVLDQALSRKLDTESVRFSLYGVALATQDTVLRKQQENWAHGKPLEIDFLRRDASEAAAHGHLRQAGWIGRQAIDRARQLGWKGAEADIHALLAEYFGIWGRSREAEQETEAALSFSLGNKSLLRSASFALIFAGAADRLGPVLAESDKLYPRDTFMQQGVAPLARALQQARRGNSGDALETLQQTARFSAFPAPVAYGRALGLLYAGRVGDAKQQFQKVLDLRYLDQSSYVTFAHLGLARAAASSGNLPEARKHYEDFFALVNDADSDIPILKQTKAEYAKLQ